MTAQTAYPIDLETLRQVFYQEWATLRPELLELEKQKEEALTKIATEAQEQLAVLNQREVEARVKIQAAHEKRQLALEKIQKEAKCISYCDQGAIAGGVWCGKVFKTFLCQSACATAVYHIQQGCYWCCEGDGL